MTHATNSDNVSPATIDWQPLLDRLCDVQAQTVFFPVRHHSPAAAAMVGELIDRLRPAAVLLEGPSDFNPFLHELQLDHQLPLAIYSYFRNGAGQPRGAYYPFSDYSPEWVALRTANRVGAAIQFIDLPWSEICEADSTTHRYADAELRRSRYVAELCNRLGVENFDDLWDKIIESHVGLDLPDYLRRVHSLCFQIRLWEETISAADRRREAFMARQIVAAKQQYSGRVLVVTGGFHSSALAARLAEMDCPGIDDPPSRDATSEFTDRGIALLPYSYERLDNLSGYNAGMPSPGFYDHAWQQRQRCEAYSHTPLLKLLVGELRAKGQVASTADLIAIETSARGLAALRGRSQVWRRDLIDAVTSALIKDELEYGCASPFIDAVHAVLRGKRRGQLAAGIRLPALVLDIRNQLRQAGLETDRGTRAMEFNLLDPEDRLRSQLLHRLAILEIAGFRRTGGTDFFGRRDLTQLWESWRIIWSPEFDGKCIESSRYGVTLVEAAASRLMERFAEADRNAARTAALLIEAAQAGIETISGELIEQLERRLGQETEFAPAAETLGHLLFLFCYDEAFGTVNVPRIGALVAEAWARALWLLETLGTSTSPAASLIDGLRSILETFQRTEGRIDIDREEFVAVMQRVERDRNKPPQIRGAAAGILWSLGQVSPDRVLAEMLLSSDPEKLGDFLTGLFALAREVVQRHPAFLEAIDRVMMDLSAEEFQHSLPALRLAFTYFTPREKHYMLSTLFESLGVTIGAPLGKVTVDSGTAVAALVLEDRLFGILRKHGLDTSLTAGSI